MIGPQTKSSLQNFPFSLPPVQLDLIYAITEIKWAAALANQSTKDLEPSKSSAIISACKQILGGKYNDQFVTCSLQGGAGTSINMNVNEVIGNLAKVHPNDHVNMSQSTNDVNPSALKIVCLRLTKTLISNLDHLIKVLNKKTNEYKHIQKLGRTHYQDAVPTTLGNEFATYAAIVARHQQRLSEALNYLYDLNLGGTAIGNAINASPTYIKAVYKELAKITHLSLKPAPNLALGTQSPTDFCHLSSLLTLLFTDLSKIAKDLRFLASGPKGGIAEISLAPLQPGSSIMPGKVNPVIPEVINQSYYLISGHNLTIQHAAEGAGLELAVMFPILADSLITSLKVASTAVTIFADKCIATLTANEANCKKHLENSTAYATLLTPRLGYDTVSGIVKEAIASGKTIRELILEKHLLPESKFDQLTQI